MVRLRCHAVTVHAVCAACCVLTTLQVALTSRDGRMYAIYMDHHSDGLCELQQVDGAASSAASQGDVCTTVVNVAEEVEVVVATATDINAAGFSG
jgi:hypothetical protein